MDLAENLKKTLDNTYNLAIGLEQVSSMIVPRKIGQRGRKRLINIHKEIKNLSQIMNSKDKYTRKEKSERQLLQKSLNPSSKKEIKSEIPSFSVKRRLSNSIKEVNQRVKLSRAGKRSIGVFMQDSQVSPGSKNLITIRSISIKGSSQRLRSMESMDDRPQPYVSFTNGKIEDPITLPTFDEFLEAKGDEFAVRKGKDDLFYRIDKASEQLDKLSDTLNSRINQRNKEERKTNNRRISLNFTSRRSEKHETLFTKWNKKNDIKELMNQYFAMPSYYKSPETHKHASSNTPSLTVNTNSSEEALDESLRTFYQAKVVENRKLSDILDKIAIDRPKNLREKLKLIQEDTEKYKNKDYSIEKFRKFRERIERNKRASQFKAYEQGLIYLEILDEFKRKRYEPGPSELIILDSWRKMIEAGHEINKTDFEEIVSLLSPSDLNQKDVQSLLDKFTAIC